MKRRVEHGCGARECQLCIEETCFRCELMRGEVESADRWEEDEDEDDGDDHI